LNGPTGMNPRKEDGEKRTLFVLARSLLQGL
jgi:hypothetical protein